MVSKVHKKCLVIKNGHIFDNSSWNSMKNPWEQLEGQEVDAARDFNRVCVRLLTIQDLSATPVVAIFASSGHGNVGHWSCEDAKTLQIEQADCLSDDGTLHSFGTALAKNTCACGCRLLACCYKQW